MKIKIKCRECKKLKDPNDIVKVKSDQWKHYICEDCFKVYEKELGGCPSDPETEISVAMKDALRKWGFKEIEK